jgi:GTP-binding protein HflX
VTPEVARLIVNISRELNRQIGLLITREGVISHVIIGDAKGIFIPSLEGYPPGKRPLRGMRLVHTHLQNERLTQDDLTDLSLLRLDLIAALGVDDQALREVQVAHLAPYGVEKFTQDLHDAEFDFRAFVGSLEEEMNRTRLFDQEDPRERAGGIQ